MEVKILSREHGMADVQVSLPGSELTKAIDAEFEKRRQAPDFNLPREGADANPEARELMQEVVRTLFSGVYQDALRQTELPVASDPKVSVVQVSEADGAVYRMRFALRPQVKLGRYKGIHVKMPNTGFTEEEFQEALRQVEEEHIVPVKADRPAKLGDVALIDFEGFLDGVAFQGGKGENHPLTLGSGQFIPGFEDQLVGASAGEKVDVNVTFPEQYHAADLAGKPVVFKVTVKEIRELQQTPLNEGEKQELRNSMARKKQEDADQEVEDQVLAIILQDSPVELPDAMVESEANICIQEFAAQLMSRNMTFDQFCQDNGKTYQSVLEEMKPLAVRRIRLRLVLSEIAKAEGFAVEDSEVENALEEMAVQMGADKDMVRRYLGPDGEAEMRADLLMRKTYTFLRESTILDP